MSEFRVEVKRVIIEPHPDADKIELGKVDGYVSIVSKGLFKTGDLAAYIPENAILPEKIIEELGVVGLLVGSLKNRVKAKRLRGIFSQGLLYPARKIWVEGQDVAEELGIVKYEPVIPQAMRGRAVGAALEITVNFDIENIKKEPHAFDGKIVVMTEKIHGTFVQIGYVPSRLHKPFLDCGCFVLSSKSLGARGICLDIHDEKSVHARTMKQLNLYPKLVCIKAEYRGLIADEPIFMLGEVFGPGVQDLTYTDKISFRLFDICFGERGNQKYFDYLWLEQIAKDYELEMVPEIYRGWFSQEALGKATTGKETISGISKHMREGVVVKNMIGPRMIFKSVSEDYLLRKGEITEFN